MTDLWEDLILPFLLFACGLVFIIFLIAGIGYGIQAFFDSKECKIWGGQYSVSTGCLMKYEDKFLTLKDYQFVTRTTIDKPIPVNANITLKGGQQ